MKVTAAKQPRSYGSGARILSIGIASTGVLTFAYFALASHVLSSLGAKRIDVLAAGNALVWKKRALAKSEGTASGAASTADAATEVAS